MTDPVTDAAARQAQEDPFLRACVRCMLWSENDESDPETGGSPLDDNYWFEDVHATAVLRLAKDCQQFQTECAEDLLGLDEEQCGHDFWLSRNGHGAGFFDRDLGDRGDRLQEAAERFGNLTPYVAEGTIYFLEVQ